MSVFDWNHEEKSLAAQATEGAAGEIGSLTLPARMGAWFRRHWRYLLIYAVLLSLLFGFLLITVSVCMVHVTEPSVLSAEEAVGRSEEQNFDCILVLGAGLRSDGTPSAMLSDRVQVACDLYAAALDEGRAVPLLMSGDHTGDYNEVAAMKELAIRLGVPSEDVFLDHKGYSTYESLCRAREVYGARRVLIVTQEFHLPRALFIARELGMDAVGVAADLRPYAKAFLQDGREMLARYKDLFVAARGDVVGKNDAKVDLSSNGDDT